MLPTPTLHTARLMLRPFTDADKGDIFALHSSPRVMRYWDSPPWSERARAERFIYSLHAGGARGQRRGLAHRAHGRRLRSIGWCGLSNRNSDFRSATISYCFDERAAWGQGFATEAANALLQWALATMDLNRVHAEADTRNMASGRVLEKLGFVREGTLREL